MACFTSLEDRMNKQRKSDAQRGIEWTDYTWNPVGGCKHACRWQMPDGETVICYAESVANGVAQSAYPRGFKHHYWSPTRLDEPLKLKTPARIFLDSMSDLVGAWVPDEHILAVLDVVRRADWHEFQLLTKNAPRLMKFADELPPNLWVGVSMPPSLMLGHMLDVDRQQRYMSKALRTLFELRHFSPFDGVLWLSLEPLSFDVAPLLMEYAAAEFLDWLVIGAASNGRTYYQPEPAHVQRVLDFADGAQEPIPVFFKGNLKWTSRREAFPAQRNGQE